MVVGVQWRLTARRAWRRMVEARLHGRLLVHRVELLLAELGHVRALVPGALLLRHRRTCRRRGGGARDRFGRGGAGAPSWDEGCRKTCTAPGGENKRTKIALANLAINAPRTPARAYPGEAEAGDHEVGIRLRVVLAPARWRAIAPSPIAMDEEASWRRLGAQVLWYRRDNLASNLKLLAVTQLVRNRTRAA